MIATRSLASRLSIAILLAGIFFALGSVCCGQDTPPPTDPNWAKRLMEDDPLVKKETVSLQDIRDGLEDPKRRDRVITDHFQRVKDASFEERRQFLIDALKSDFPEVQRQAAQTLWNEMELEWVVHDLLVEFMETQNPKSRDAAIVGLEQLVIPPDEPNEEYWRTRIELLSDPDEYVALLTSHRLQMEGFVAIPSLLKAFKTGHPRLPLVAETLADIVLSSVGSRFAAVAPAAAGEEPARAASEKMAPVPPATVVKSDRSTKEDHAIRDVDIKKPTSVTVYYGTNRELIDRPRPSLTQILPYPLIALLLLVGTVAFIRSKPANPQKKRGCLRWMIPVLMLLGIVWSLMVFDGELQQYWRLGTGPSFGPRRDAAEVVHYGTCEVSIPPRHEVGVVERPILGRENEQEHVVLKRTEELEAQAFFEAVRTRLVSLPKTSKSCFVFIHGFNVDFENAARRTAQIHYDLQFEGVPIFFSWPSRANVRHYFSDRNEIEFSRYVIKQFLVDIADKVSADRIHVIAHSMGADATCRAIAELGERGKIFDQIVLAAPDIDREVFRVQLAPKLTKTARRTTLYCSKNDLALMLSRSFNDSNRAGDSSNGALVLHEVDTVDASEIDTDLLGHSYYGDCLPLLNDVQQLLGESLPPEQRHLRPWPVEEDLLYWTLPEPSNQPKQPETPTK